MLRSWVKGSVLCLLAGFSFASPSWAAEKVPVFVSILPQKYFVEKIGGDRVDVRVMVEPGASPHTYEPKPGQMAALSKTRLYFAIGVTFEKIWLKRISAASPKMKVVHTDRGIEKRQMAAHHHHHHEGGESGHGERHHPHDHHGLDPHVWLSPPLVKIQARNILAALQEADSANRDIYEDNYRGFITGVDRLDARLRSMFAGKEGFRFMVFHPAWGYFADAYGLEQVPIEIEGKDPKPAQLKNLIEHARKEGINVVFVQPQFSARSARVVASEINGQVVFADPLAEDWTGNLLDVADRFQSALK